MYFPRSRHSALQSGDLDRIRYKGKQRDIKMQHSQLHRRIRYCRGMDSRRWRGLPSNGSYGCAGYYRSHWAILNYFKHPIENLYMD